MTIFGILPLTESVLALLAGTVVGIIAGLMPGLSSRSVLLMAVPFLLSYEPLTAVIVLVALHAAAQISGTVPAALFGAPTSGSEAATAVDGFPLSKQGSGARLVGLIISSSAIGGIAGAIALLFALPLVSPLILRMGSPEIAALACAGLLAIAAVSSTGILVAVAAGCVGIVLSTVGVSAASGAARLTFGQVELLDGLSAPALIAGIMALPDLLRHEAPRPFASLDVRYRQTLRGMLDPFRHFWLLLRSTMIGLVVGITPGLGSSVASWLSYSVATRVTRPRTAFGSGAVEGVIAPEVASGAKEGAAYLPTLLLGVPGSSSMAILLSAFAIIGVHVGPSVVPQQSIVPALVGYGIIAAQLLALVLCLLLAPVMSRLSTLPRREVAAFAIVASAYAVYYAEPSASALWQTLAFACCGLVLMSGNVPRPPLLIGFVIGPILESSILRSAQIYGAATFSRPGVLIILASLACGVVYLWFVNSRSHSRPHQEKTGRAATLVLAVMALAFFLCQFAISQVSGLAAIFPFWASLIGLVASIGAVLISLLDHDKISRTRTAIDWLLTGVTAAGLFGALFIGPWTLAAPLGIAAVNILKRLAPGHSK